MTARAARRRTAPSRSESNTRGSLCARALTRALVASVHARRRSPRRPSSRAPTRDRAVHQGRLDPGRGAPFSGAQRGRARRGRRRLGVDRARLRARRDAELRSCRCRDPGRAGARAAAVCSDARRERRSSCGSRCTSAAPAGRHHVRGRRAHDEMLPRADAAAVLAAAWSRDGAGGELAFDATVAGGFAAALPARRRDRLLAPPRPGDGRCDRRRAARAARALQSTLPTASAAPQRRQRDVVLRRVTRRSSSRSRTRPPPRRALGARCAGVSGSDPAVLLSGVPGALKRASEAKACSAPRARARATRTSTAERFRVSRAPPPRLLATQPPRRSGRRRRRGVLGRVTALPGAAKSARRDRSARAASPRRGAPRPAADRPRPAAGDDASPARLAKALALLDGALADLGL